MMSQVSADAFGIGVMVAFVLVLLIGGTIEGIKHKDMSRLYTPILDFLLVGGIVSLFIGVAWSIGYAIDYYGLIGK